MGRGKKKKKERKKTIHQMQVFGCCSLDLQKTNLNRKDKRTNSRSNWNVKKYITPAIANK